jgi:hypothetical protein
MAYIKQEEIIGYRLHGQVICSDCATEEERKKKFTAKEIITKDTIDEDDFCFCDRCLDDLRDSAAQVEAWRTGPSMGQSQKRR